MSIQTPLCPINGCGVPMVLFAQSSDHLADFDEEEGDGDNHGYNNDNDCNDDGDGSYSEEQKNNIADQNWHCPTHGPQ